MYLLDVNVLLALVLGDHVFHEVARHWFVANREKPFATCAITESGLVRLLMNPAINPNAADADSALEILNRIHDHPMHRYINALPSIRDAMISVHLRKTKGYRQITDAYLVGVAQVNQGKLLTADRKIEQYFGREHVELI